MPETRVVKGNPRAAKASRVPVRVSRVSDNPAVSSGSVAATAAHAAPAAPAPQATEPRHLRAVSRKGPLRRVLRALSTALLAVVVLLAVALVGVRLVGLEPYAVLSGSMEPTYHVGSVIYVKDADPADLEPGDVITFMLDEDMVATHRIVEVVPDADDPEVVRFRTKGDANDAPDGSLVHCKNVVGEAVLDVPYLGYAAAYVQGPPGCWVALAACAVVVMLTFLPDLLAKEEEPEPARPEGGRASRADAPAPRGRHAR